MPGGGGKGGGGDSTVTVNNAGTVQLDADSTVTVAGLDNIQVTTKLEPTPLKTESKQELVLPQPLKTESKSDITTDNSNKVSVDLQPVALDLCMTTNLGKLPHGVVRQPYRQHIGFTWFGVEILGFNFTGETKVVLEDLPKRPLVEWPAQQNVEQAGGGAEYRGGDGPSRPERPGFRQPLGAGLRVRVK